MQEERVVLQRELWLQESRERSHRLFLLYSLGEHTLHQNVGTGWEERHAVLEGGAEQRWNVAEEHSGQNLTECLCLKKEILL